MPKRIKKTNRIKYLKWLILLIIISYFGVSHYTKKIDQLIALKFNQEKKWNIPSRIYTDSEYIFIGYDIAKRELVKKLDRLSYRQVEKIKLPGDYSLNESYIDIYLHDFNYPNENFLGYPVRLDISSNIVTEMKSLASDEIIDLVKLEPEELAPIFDSSMEKRTIVKLEDVPDMLIGAILLIEDERFFKHHGVDPKGILRAFVTNITHASIRQGGSTLTQQLVKNFFLYPRKSITRKIKEMFIAWRIEKTHSKSEILEAYLNEIYLGQRGTVSINGFGEASKHYFGKNINQLSTAECAFLAGIIRAPNRYNPFSDTTNAKERRDFVLSKLFENGFIDKTQYEEALAEPIVTPKLIIQNIQAPYFVEFVKQELSENFPPDILQSDGLKIFTTLDMTAQIFAEDSIKTGLSNIETSHAKKLNPEKSLQVCLIDISPSTGYLRAMVGGRNYFETQFNRCTQGLRQTGSTFKPFVYLTAFSPERSEKTYTPATIIEDVSFTIEAGGKNWTPSNYDETDHGNITLRTALENSYNIATAKLAIDVGLENVVKTARDAGITSPLEAVPSLALGAYEATPMELAYAYSIFANGGMRVEPIAITQVVTQDGEVLKRRHSKTSKAFDPRAIYLTTNILRGVLQRGTGASAKAYGYDGIGAGKTGTTSDYKDAWFVGFTPFDLALVWTGYDDNTKTGLTGASGALPIWAKFMSLMESKSERNFMIPKGIKFEKIDLNSGYLAGKECEGNVILEAFIEGTEPEEECSKENQQNQSQSF